jgi:hypothetical protein
LQTPQTRHRRFTVAPFDLERTGGGNHRTVLHGHAVAWQVVDGEDDFLDDIGGQNEAKQLLASREIAERGGDCLVRGGGFQRGAGRVDRCVGAQDALNRVAGAARRAGGCSSGCTRRRRAGTLGCAGRCRARR